MRQRGNSRGWSWRLAYWGLPLVLIWQYLGNVPNKTLLVTGLYAGIFVYCLWFSQPGAGDSSRPRRSESRLAGVSLLALGTIGAGLGLAHLFSSPDWFAEAFESISWMGPRDGARLLLFAAAWPIGVGLTLVQGGRVDSRTFLRVCGLLALAGLAMLAAGQRYEGLALLPDESTLVAVALWFAAGCLALLVLIAPRRPVWWLGGLLAAGLFVRATGLGVWEIDPATRDMLALIMSAHDSLLAGENPYRLHQMQVDSVVPLTYLPGMWLAYLPPRLVDLDIRWMGLVADAVIVVSLWLAARGGGRRTLTVSRSIDWRQAAALGVGAVWLFLPSVHWNGIYAEPHVWWAVLAALLAAVALRRWWAAAALLGLAVCTRHFGVVVLPFVLVAMVRDLGWRQMVPRLAVSGGVAAVLLTPFVAWDSDSFWFGTFRWLREYGPEHQTWFYRKFGFAGPMYEHGLADWLPLAQGAVIIVFGLVALAVVGPRENRRFFGVAGAAYLFFVMFNGLIWQSFYLGAALFVAFAAAAAPRVPGAADRRVEGRAWRIGALVLAVAIGLGGWMATTLYDARRPSGLDEAREYLHEEAREGDLVVDHSDWRVAFVEGERFFGDNGPPEGVEVVDDLFGPDAPPVDELLGGERARGQWWMVTRELAAFDETDEFGALGRVVDDRRFGDVRVIGVDPRRADGSVMGSLERLKVSFAPDEGTSFSLEPEENDAPDRDDPAVSDQGPGWLEVRPKRCKFEGRRREMVYAHPKEDGALRLVWEDVPVANALLLTAGVESPAVRWGREPVELAVAVDGEPVDTLEIPNLPGLHWEVMSTDAKRGQRADIELEVTTDDDGQRWTCVDGFFLNEDD